MNIEDVAERARYSIEQRISDANIVFSLMDALEVSTEGLTPFQTEMFSITCESLNIDRASLGCSLESLGTQSRALSYAMESLMDTLKGYVSKIIEFIRTSAKDLKDLFQKALSKIDKNAVNAVIDKVKATTGFGVNVKKLCAELAMVDGSSNPLKAISDYKSLYEDMVSGDIHARIARAAESTIALVRSAEKPDGFRKIAIEASEGIQFPIPQGFSIWKTEGGANESLAIYQSQAGVADRKIFITGLAERGDQGKRGGMIRSASLAKAGKVRIADEPEGTPVELSDANMQQLIAGMLEVYRDISADPAINVAKSLDRVADDLQREFDSKADVSNDQGKFVMGMVHGVSSMATYSASLLTNFLKLTNKYVAPLTRAANGDAKEPKATGGSRPESGKALAPA